MTETTPNSATPEREGENGHGRFKLIHDVTLEVAALFDATQHRPRASIVKTSEIEEITDHKKNIVDDQGRLIPNSIYAKIVKKWKRRMIREQGIFPIASYGVGYQFPTVEEQETIVPDALEKQGARKIKQAQIAVQVIKENEMTDDQKRLRRERIRQTNESLDLGRTHVAERKSYLSNPDTLPKWRAVSNGER